MKSTHWIFICTLMVTAIGCSSQKIDKTNWLIGTWQNSTTKVAVFESWKKINPTTLEGISFVIKNGDTVVFETIQLTQQNDSLYYIPTVNNQNDALPIRFSETRLESDNLEFVNLKHDFPQKISYTQINADSLVAKISGQRNGKLEERSFEMKRVK